MCEHICPSIMLLCHMDGGLGHTASVPIQEAPILGPVCNCVLVLTNLRRKWWCGKFFIPLPLQSDLTFTNMFPNWCDKFLRIVCVCVSAPVYVRVSPPRGPLPIGLGPHWQFRPAQSMHPNWHTTMAGNQLSPRRTFIVEENIFFGQSSRFRGLAWPGKVPELGLRAQMLLGSYLLRFLHEQLNCCNIGLGGL